MDDGRHFSRVPFRIEAEVQSEGGTFQGEVKNLSLKGALIAVPDSHPVGEAVDVKIYLAEDEPDVVIEVEGKVVRADQEGIAVLFTKVELSSFIHLRNLVALNIGDGDAVMNELSHFLEERLREEDATPGQ
jgi:hypothetical protein